MAVDAHLKARVDRVAAKLATAARRPGEPVMFGASAHRFALGPPLPDDEPYCGTLALSDQGCGYLSILVVSGPARGRVTDNSDNPAGPDFTGDADFLSWYERWLDAVLAGAKHFR